MSQEVGETIELQIAFHAHTAQVALQLHLNWREVRYKQANIHAPARHLSAQQARVSALELAEERSAHLLREWEQLLPLRTHRWTERGVQRRMVRSLQRRHPATLDELLAHLRLWSGQDQCGLVLPPRLFPEFLVAVSETMWDLTPWTRLDVPFHCTAAYLAGRAPYEQEAARFWIEHEHAPSAEEEHSAEVRERVAANMERLRPPAWLTLDKRGAFRRLDDAVGEQRFSLRPQAMPGGDHFMLVTPEGYRIFSVDGGVPRVRGVRTAPTRTEQLSDQYRVALLSPEARRRVEWHPAGVIFKQLCLEAGVEAVENSGHT